VVTPSAPPRPTLVVHLYRGADRPEPLPEDEFFIDSDDEVDALAATVRARASAPCPPQAVTDAGNPAPQLTPTTVPGVATVAPLPVAAPAPAPVAPVPATAPAATPPAATVAAPARQRAVIGDTVWNDRDENAAPSPGEPGVQGARVVIENRATGDRQLVTTDATGAYRAAVEPGDYEVTLDMATVDGELTTAEEFEFSVDEGEVYLSADFGLDGLYGDGSLPYTGSTTTTSVTIGLLALVAGAVALGSVRLIRRRA
jgi:LPXTG-motif cell wall-anchored protein